MTFQIADLSGSRRREPGVPDPGAARFLAVALTAVAAFWAVAILLSPLLVHRGRGITAMLPAGVYETARLVCHQRPERSFHIAGVPMPVCARCSGLYLSGAAGALLAWARRRPRRVPPGSWRLTVALAALPMAASVAGEMAGLIPSSNISRLISALPLGAAAGWIFVGALRAEAAPDDGAVAL